MALVKEPTEFTLPTKRSVPSNRLEDYSILIHGEKKIGKTTLANQFKNALFFGFEPGTKAIAVFRVNINGWWDFVKYRKLYVKSKYQTGVVDTVDIAYRQCLAAVCEKLGIDHPADEGYGKGWDRVRSAFLKEMTIIQNCNRGAIFISHSEEKEIKDRRGNSYHKIVSSMSGQCASVLEGSVDIWCYYHYDGDARVITIVGDDQIAAGHRCEGHFLYTDGSPIKRFSAGTSAKAAYANFVAAFNNQLTRPASSEAVRKTKKRSE